MTLSKADYDRLARRFLHALAHAVPSDAVVAVISKGDDRLLEIGGATAWHFPRRSDGLYAGHYPADDRLAIAHLEALRAKGAQFLAVPATAGWWLDHYRGFRTHLESNYHLVVSDEEVGSLYTLFKPGARHAAVSADADDASSSSLSATVGAPLGDEEKLAGEMRSLFDQAHYESQTGLHFVDAEEALTHYLDLGYQRWDPHPLFDTAYYLRCRPQARARGAVPLLDFLTNGRTLPLDPSPYFDSAHYAEQARLSDGGAVAALLHYLAAGSDAPSANPNPLFVSRYYVRENPEVRALGMNPLVHYLTRGAAAGRVVSFTHKSIVDALSRQGAAGLQRGRWVNSCVLLFASGEPSQSEALLRMATMLSEDHHAESILLWQKRPDVPDAWAGSQGPVVLEDYETACEVLRPSAVRMLMRTLVGLHPDRAVTDAPGVLHVLRTTGVPTFFLGGSLPALSRVELTDVCAAAERVVLPSAKVFAEITSKLGTTPTRVALRPRPRPLAGTDPGDETDRYADQVIDLLRLTPVAVDAGGAPSSRGSAVMPRVLIPCSDWSVSGVNASLHALGSQLVDMGWHVEIVFTRDPSHVIENAGGEEHLPSLPFRFLERKRRGVEAMWAALIADVECGGPTILFMSYDFLANSAAPALTERVGVVAWVQSDDGDYYEQAYRLGRYCNAVVSVSQHIKDSVVALNPALEDRTHVIHNASVWPSDVVKRKKMSRDRLRLIYTGRLVQYQKRILDFLDLAAALDEREVPYTITLIGDFNPREGISEQFRLRAGSHLADERIMLAGRLPRAEILNRLSAHDFFLLLSDFEGLPLSLVEAMARGCVPVTAPMASGIPEIVRSGENGLIVPDRDYGKWADQLIQLWRDPRDYRHLSKNARLTVLQDFTVERAAGRFDALFRSIGNQIESSTFERPPSLHWGAGKSQFGDILPPPTMYRSGKVAGLS